MTDSFFTGGPERHADALREQYETALNDLRKRRDTANDAERTRLEDEIERAELDYKSKINSIDDSLF